MRDAGPTRNWSDIYEYFQAGGVSVYFFAGITDVIIASLIALAPILLFGCIDYSAISTAENLGQIVCSLSKGFANVPLFVKIGPLLFYVHTLMIFVKFIWTLIRFFSMRNYFIQTLGIFGSELRRMSWGDIIESVQVNDNALDATKLAIAQEIMRRDNYICAMVSDPSLLIWKFPPSQITPSLIPMSRFFFRWFNLSLFSILLDRNGSSLVPNTPAANTTQVQHRLKLRFRLLGLLQFALIPFMLPYQILYEIYDFAKTLTRCGLTFSLRSWSFRSRWVIRDYNELPHFLRARLRESYSFANAYLDQSSEFSVPVARALQFASGLLIAIVFLLSLLTDFNVVLTTKLFFGKNIAWFVVILLAIYFISRGIASSDGTETVESAMLGIERLIHYDFRDEHHSAQSGVTRGRVESFFQPIWRTALAELLSTFVNPFLFLVFLPERAGPIAEFVRKNSVDGGPLGWVAAFATFDVGERGFAGSAGHREKVLRSKHYFDTEPTGNEEGDGALALLPRATSPLIRTDFGSNEALSEFAVPPVFGDDM
jgi:autophagy-related protein 9